MCRKRLSGQKALVGNLCVILERRGHTTCCYSLCLLARNADHTIPVRVTNAPCRYLGYNSLKDFFPTMEIKPNVSCCNPLCISAQHAHQQRVATPEAVAAAAAAAAEEAELAATAPVHEDNDWGIVVVSVPGCIFCDDVRVSVLVYLVVLIICLLVLWICMQCGPWTPRLACSAVLGLSLYFPLVLSPLVQLCGGLLQHQQRRFRRRAIWRPTAGKCRAAVLFTSSTCLFVPFPLA